MGYKDEQITTSRSRITAAIQAAVSVAITMLHDEETGAVSTAPARKGKAVKPVVQNAIDKRRERFQRRK